MSYDSNDNPHFIIGTMGATINSLLKALENTKAPTNVVDKIQYDVAIEMATEYMATYNKEVAYEV